VSGHPLGQKHHEADRWIAATARWLDVALVAHDAVFRDSPGVTVITELA
jgi:predicted nucleic acid-binding protein